MFYQKMVILNIFKIPKTEFENQIYLKTCTWYLQEAIRAGKKSSPILWTSFTMNFRTRML